MPSENFGSPAPKKSEQLLALPQTSGNGSSSLAPVCSATVRSSVSLVAWTARKAAIGMASPASGATRNQTAPYHRAWIEAAVTRHP